MRTFVVIWAGQVLSLMGSGLSGFALGVWVFQRTGSATQFAMIALAATLPAVLASPLAGVMVDRWDRRRVMILSDSIAALGTAALALLYWRGALELWHILVASALGATMGAFQGPAYQASVTLLVPKEQYGRASGMAQMGQALAGVLSPLLAGVLLVTIGVTGVLLIDLGSYFIALGTLLAVRIPSPVAERVSAAATSIWREAREGWRAIADRRGLRDMLLLFALLNFLLGMVNALGAPLLLSFLDPAKLGGVLSLAGIGMLAGSLLMSLWGGPRRKIHGVLGFMVLTGLGVALVGLRPSPLLVTAGFFTAMLFAPVVNGSSQAIWQRKVPARIQGRVFATRRMVSLGMAPLAYLLAGPLADHFFGPLMDSDGALAPTLGRWLGAGPGRGIGLMFVLFGLAAAIAPALAYLNPALRRVEEDLPDAEEPALVTPEPAPPQPEAAGA
ncbi:MFS transporter [bacterium]|nr:MFS transporter [bacterium]